MIPVCLQKCPRYFFFFRIDAYEMFGDEHSFSFKCSSSCEQFREAEQKEDMQDSKELGTVPREKAKAICGVVQATNLFTQVLLGSSDGFASSPEHIS